jgi:hypothetical protein
MSLIKWHEDLSSKIRTALLFFIVLIILDCSTIFNITITDTLTLSSNLSTWLSSFVLGSGITDSFTFNIVSVYLLLVFLLFGAIKAPFRNIWVLKFTILSTSAIIIITTYTLIDASNSSAVLLNSTFQSLKLIPLVLAYYWTRQLATPILI